MQKILDRPGHLDVLHILATDRNSAAAFCTQREVMLVLVSREPAALTKVIQWTEGIWNACADCSECACAGASAESILDWESFSL